MWMVTRAVEVEIRPGVRGEDDIASLQQQVANLTERLELLEQVTYAVEVQTNNTSSLLHLEEQVANLTRRLQLLEKN